MDNPYHAFNRRHFAIASALKARGFRRQDDILTDGNAEIWTVQTTPELGITPCLEFHVVTRINRVGVVINDRADHPHEATVNAILAACGRRRMS